MGSSHGSSCLTTGVCFLSSKSEIPLIHNLQVVVKKNEALWLTQWTDSWHPVGMQCMVVLNSWGVKHHWYL